MIRVNLLKSPWSKQSLPSYRTITFIYYILLKQLTLTLVLNHSLSLRASFKASSVAS